MMVHYIYRFKYEFMKGGDYHKTVDRCHSTVGIAILNYLITIVFGYFLFLYYQILFPQFILVYLLVFNDNMESNNIMFSVSELLLVFIPFW